MHTAKSSLTSLVYPDSAKTPPVPLGLPSRSQSAPGKVSSKAFGWRWHPRETSPATACHTCQGTALTGFWEGAGLGLCCVISYTQWHLRHLGEKGQVMEKTQLFRLHLISWKINNLLWKSTEVSIPPLTITEYFSQNTSIELHLLECWKGTDQYCPSRDQLHGLKEKSLMLLP